MDISDIIYKITHKRYLAMLDRNSEAAIFAARRKRQREQKALKRSIERDRKNILTALAKRAERAARRQARLRGEHVPTQHRTYNRKLRARPRAQQTLMQITARRQKQA